jgi:hypothetical protein
MYVAVCLVCCQADNIMQFEFFTALAEDFNHVGYNTVWLSAWLGLNFKGLSSGEYEGIEVLWNIKNHSSHNTVPHATSHNTWVLLIRYEALSSPRWSEKWALLIAVSKDLFCILRLSNTYSQWLWYAPSWIIQVLHPVLVWCVRLVFWQCARLDCCIIFGYFQLVSYSTSLQCE